VLHAPYQRSDDMDAMHAAVRVVDHLSALPARILTCIGASFGETIEAPDIVLASLAEKQLVDFCGAVELGEKLVTVGFMNLGHRLSLPLIYGEAPGTLLRYGDYP
jgi:hypothetical protein